MAAAPQTAAQPAGASASLPQDFRSLVQSLEAAGRHQLAVQLHDQIGIVRYAPGELVLRPLRPLGSDWSRDLAATLKSLTGASWTVAISDEPGQPSLQQQEVMAEEKAKADVLADPNVRAVLDAFPDAALESYSSTKG